MTRAIRRPRDPDTVNAYLSALLRVDPDEFLAATGTDQAWCRSLSSHALILEGEHLDVALPLDGFAGVELRHLVPGLTVLSVDTLVRATPEPAPSAQRLVIKLRDSHLGISCLRADRVVKLRGRELARAPGEARHWLLGIIKPEWALVIDPKQLQEALEPAPWAAGTEHASDDMADAVMTGS